MCSETLYCVYGKQQRHFLSIPTWHRTRESQLVWRLTVSRCKTPSQWTSSQTTNTFPSGDKMRGDARTELALCHRVILDSVAHWWVPARTPTVHQCLHWGKLWRAKDTLHAPPPQWQDQGCCATPWFTNTLSTWTWATELSEIWTSSTSVDKLDITGRLRPHSDTNREINSDILGIHRIEFKSGVICMSMLNDEKHRTTQWKRKKK